MYVAGSDRQKAYKSEFDGPHPKKTAACPCSVFIDLHVDINCCEIHLHFLFKTAQKHRPGKAVGGITFRLVDIVLTHKQRKQRKTAHICTQVEQGSVTRPRGQVFSWLCETPQTGRHVGSQQVCLFVHTDIWFNLMKFPHYSVSAAHTHMQIHAQNSYLPHTPVAGASECHSVATIVVGCHGGHAIVLVHIQRDAFYGSGAP